MKKAPPPGAIQTAGLFLYHFVDVNKMVSNQKRQKKKAPSAVQRAGGMQKGGPLPAPKASARGTGLVNLLYHILVNPQIYAENTLN